ncbi:MAG TPA: PPC domain-containing protein [Terriglobia bacterium]|nr:PPC domain-containing protein [Terriglobia bacterium]
MKTRIILIAASFALGLAIALPLIAEEPIIPPTVSKIWPVGMQRGATATFTLDGRNIAGAKEVIFDATGITGKVVQITDVAEKITGPRAGVDLGAQVPQGKKQTAQMEITVAKDVEPGLHWFRIQTPLGTSNMSVIAIDSLPEVTKSPKPSADSAAQPETVKLPATLIGALTALGETDSYQFEGKAGEELVFQVMASELGSRLESVLVLRDADGKVVASAGENDNKPDAVLTCKLPQDGQYTLSISDREHGGGMDHYYRVNAGPLPYITNVFPLGVQAGKEVTVAVKGVNLGGLKETKVDPPKSADGWATMPLEIKTGGGVALNKVKLAVGNDPEFLEQEPNSTPAEAQTISLPVTINGLIDGGAKAGGAPDEDFFRFHARRGEQTTIEVAAARLGSHLDSLIEVLDAKGNPIPRATVRCLNQTTTTLSDRDSRSEGVRLTSTSGLREGDYLMIGDELDQVAVIPDQPDADAILKGINGLRLAFLGTSPDVHAVNTTVYKAQILPPDAEFPPNGLPVFHLTWRNDDGGPGYGADSRLDFVAPIDADYILHLKDVRGLEGPDFAYRLTLRDASPDFQLRASPENPNIPKGGEIPVTVSVNRLQGHEGPIDVEVLGLPQGVTASRATIPAGQDSTVVILAAAADAPVESRPTSMKIVGHAQVNGHQIEREANNGAPLQLASVIPPPDVVVATDQQDVSIEPGKEVIVTLRVNRQNGFKGRVPCNVENLPPGVRIVNVGLNGVLVTEAQTSRTFTIRAEDWAKPITQPIYVVAEVESNSSTRHSSPPLLLKVVDSKQAASAMASHVDESQQAGGNARPPNH